jgi:hypothetical protein
LRHFLEIRPPTFSTISADEGFRVFKICHVS